jgi:hypothetical protein
LFGEEESMKHEKEYRERCAARGLDSAAIERAVAAVERLEAEFGSGGGTPSVLMAVERHVADLVRRGEASEELLMAFARYFAVAGDQAIAIRLLAYLSPIGILPAMADRLEKLEGAAVRERVMAGVAVPPVGAPPEAYPAGTAAFVAALERELGRVRAARVLRWNVHGIPAAAHASEREAFLASPSVEAWLEGFHARMVAELERHAADGTLWFEQRITPRVVEFVRDNPEILGATREGDTLYATKIPYDPDRWLTTIDPLEKRRLACHCPLAASMIVAGGAGVDPLWCACSAGYEKFLFDVVFAEDTEVEVLESVLAGKGRCRFAVKIPESILRWEREKHAGST